MEQNEKPIRPSEVIEFQPENSYITDTRKLNMLEALKRSLGIISTAAKQTGISRDSHYNWMANDPHYEHAVKMIQDAAIDFVESKLFELINGVTMVLPGKKGAKDQMVYTKEPNVAAAIFYLKTKAKHRGYIERYQLMTPEVENFDLTIKIEPLKIK